MCGSDSVAPCGSFHGPTKEESFLTSDKCVRKNGFIGCASCGKDILNTTWEYQVLCSGESAEENPRKKKMIEDVNFHMRGDCVQTCG